MRFACITTIMFALVSAADPAEAQVCVGNPSFANQPYQAAVTAAFTEGAHGVGGEFGAGGETLFASAGVSVINYRDLDALATQVSAGAGTEFALEQQPNIFVCPLASVSFGVGPDVGAFDVSTINLGVGGSLGLIASQTGSLMVVPTFGLAAIYSRTSLETPAGDDFTDSDGSGRASIGVGFIFDQNIGITPAVVIPFSASNADPIFQIRLSLAFGR